MKHILQVGSITMMPRGGVALVMALVCVVVLMNSACGVGSIISSSSQSHTTTPPPTIAVTSPSPVASLAAPTTTTALPHYPANTYAGSVLIGGLPRDAAAAKLRNELASLYRPIALHVGTHQFVLRPEAIAFAVEIDAMVAEAWQQAEQASEATPIRVPLRVAYNTTLLRRLVADVAQESSIPPRITTVTYIDPVTVSGAFTSQVVSHNFVHIPGKRIAVDEALQQLDEVLHTPNAVREVSCAYHTDWETPPPRVSVGRIRDEVAFIAQSWAGTLGFYLYDLERGESVSLNGNTIFSGASVMKVPIMLYSYIQMPTFTEQQQQWLYEMIVHSNNVTANSLLSASSGTYNAFTGALDMTRILQQLGLQHTFQQGPYTITPPEYLSYGAYHPYETNNNMPEQYLTTHHASTTMRVSLTNNNAMPITINDEQTGDGFPVVPLALPEISTVYPITATETAADHYLQTTPAEISQVFVWIDQCSKGTGVLLTLFPDNLSPLRCQEMLNLLAKNGDTTRMYAGIPRRVRVEHKSGWVEDMQADVGIVRSEGGDFVLALYVYQETPYLEDGVVSPFIGALARMVYSAYNPIRASVPLE